MHIRIHIQVINKYVNNIIIFSHIILGIIKNIIRRTETNINENKIF